MSEDGGSTATGGDPSSDGEGDSDGLGRRVSGSDRASGLELPSDFSRAQRAFAVGGVVAVLLAVLGLLVPGLLPGPVAAVVTALPATVTLFLLVLLGVVLAVASSRRQPSSVEPVERAPLREPREPAARTPAVGGDVETLLSEAADLDRPREERAAAREDLRERLRAVATRLLVRETDADPAAVESALDSGDWTTDRRASALLGGPEAPEPRWYVRLWDLLRSEPAVRRRTRHAMAALRDARQRGSLSPPEPDGERSGAAGSGQGQDSRDRAEDTGQGPDIGSSSGPTEGGR